MENGKPEAGPENEPLMEKEHLQQLIRESLDYSEKQNAYCRKFYSLGEFNRMSYEQDTGKMTFSREGVIPRVVADFQIIGSLSPGSGTWLWAWDNPYLLDNTVAAVGEIREFGRKEGIPELTRPKWKAGEKEAEEMTALSAYLLKAKGSYEFLSDDIRVYAIFMEITWVGSTDPAQGPGREGIPGS